MKRGFTTIELMFVIGVSLVTVLSMLVGYINFMAMNEHNRNLTIATNIARDKMEQIAYLKRTGSFDAISSSALSSNAEVLASNYGVPNGWGTCDVTVQDTYPDFKDIGVAVSWSERGQTVTNGVLLKSAAARR